jgi:hypothetical protein
MAHASAESADAAAAAESADTAATTEAASDASTATAATHAATPAAPMPTAATLSQGDHGKKSERKTEPKKFHRHAPTSTILPESPNLQGYPSIL